MNEFQRLLRQWRNQLRRSLEERKSRQESKHTQSARPNLKMCPVCGRFNDASASTCEYCDAVLSPKRHSDFDRYGNARTHASNPVSQLFGVCVGFMFVSIVLTNLNPEYGLMDALFRPDPIAQLTLGATHIVSVTEFGEIWRLLFYMFLHGGFLHLFFNFSALAQLGPMTLEAFGQKRFWFLILFTGMMGSVASTAAGFFGLGGFSVGLSGALFGMIGACYIFARFHGNLAVAAVFKKWMIWGNIICIGLTVTGFMPIDNAAHLGGMCSGMGIVYLFYKPASAKLVAYFETGFLVFACALVVWGLVSILPDVLYIYTQGGLEDIQERNNFYHLLQQLAERP